MPCSHRTAVEEPLTVIFVLELLQKHSRQSSTLVWIGIVRENVCAPGGRESNSSTELVGIDFGSVRSGANAGRTWLQLLKGCNDFTRASPRCKITLRKEHQNDIALRHV
eukprot:110875-Prymnesium_polylepis.1